MQMERQTKDKQGVVKTEVPTKVLWVQRKCDFQKHILSPVSTNILMHTLLRTWPYQDLLYLQCWGYVLNHALTHKIIHFTPCPHVPILYMEMKHSLP